MSSTITIGPYVVSEKPPALEYQFLDSNGVALNLTGYVVKFVWREDSGFPQTRDGVLASAVSGKVTYTWQGDEFSTPGHYRAEFWVGNGTQRYASLLLVFDVRAPVGSPPNI